MHKKRIFFTIITIMLSVAVSYAAEPAKKKEMLPASAALAPYILSEKEIAGMELTLQSPISLRVTGEDGLMHGRDGVRQEWVSEANGQLYINLYVLESPAEVDNNIGTHPVLRPGYFQQGSFTGAVLGDMSWITTEPEGDCRFIVIVKGRYVLLVETNCGFGVKAAGSKLEEIAQKVLDKLPANQ